MKKSFCIFLCIIVLAVGIPFSVEAESSEDAVIDLDCPSAILIEKSTGRVLYEKNADEKRPMASVTKIMTLLLIMEAIENERISLETMVSCSAHACSMGGSQVYLKEGESLSVDDMLKAISVSSANDASVAMAEHLAGSDTSFVKMMNQKATELGMKNTVFQNCTGLDADGHYSSARDIAVMSTQILQYDLIRRYTTIWMDTLRDGNFGLSNTNKLVRFYEGCTGLKTGSTSKALYCMSASAMRDDMELIAVVLAASSSSERFEDAKKLLNYGFAEYEIFNKEISLPKQISIIGANTKTANILGDKFVNLLVKKGEANNIQTEIDIKENISAPAIKGEQVGTVTFLLGEKIVHQFPVKLMVSVKKATFGDVFFRIFSVFLTV